jgi:vitamin B12 transporter
MKTSASTAGAIRLSRVRPTFPSSARRPLARLVPLAPLGLALAAAWPALSLAQNAPAEATLRETVVTATRVEQPLADLVSDVSIVDSATIERSGATGVAEVLSRLPGIEIVRNGSIANASSVFIRGAESRFTAVYVDGVRVDSQSTGGVAWEAIPLAQIDRIEVLRGPAAAVYGSDAIGGVIQLFTRRGEGPARPYVGVGLGSRNLRRAEAGVSGSAGVDGAFDYSLGAAYEESDGFNVQPLSLRSPLRSGAFSADGYTSPDRDGYRVNSANARLGFRINPAHRLEATLLYSDTDSKYDARVPGTRPPARYADDTNANTLRTAGAAWIAKWSDLYTTRVQVTDSKSTYETQPSFYRTETQLRGYLFQNELRLGAHLVTAALERREDALDNAATSSGPRLARDRSQNALALGYGFVQGPHSVQLHARHDDDSEFGGQNTGSAAYGFAITPQWRATASVGTSFRAPTVYQRFSEYGIAGLQPEEGRNVEVGLRYAEGASSAGVVVYRNRLTNLIAYGAAGACTSLFGCYGNTARAQYEGVTFSAGHRLGDVSLRASADFQDPRDLDTDRQLARRARRHATLGADWRVMDWTLGAEVQASAMRYDDAANLRRLGGYTLFNLSASRRITSALTLIARIDNVADKDYQLARMYATGGRAAYVGLKWTPQ